MGTMRTLERRRDRANRAWCVATEMGMTSFERPQQMESGRRMFALMQGRRMRKHGERGGHDKVKCGSVISTKRFAGSRSTCVYKHHRDF